MIIRFCEFTGDGKHDWDEDGFKKKCDYVGFIPKTGQDMCCLHKQPLGGREGWRTCCESCTQPIQVKDCK